MQNGVVSKGKKVNKCKCDKVFCFLPYRNFSNIFYILHTVTLITELFTVVQGKFEFSRSSNQAGVPQSSLTGYTLFNIKTNDLRSIENDNNVTVSMYVYDTNIIVRSGSIQLAVKQIKRCHKNL
jgi:hypothetical protein